MTRYLDGKPFSSKPATSAYHDGWERTFRPAAPEPPELYSSDLANPMRYLMCSRCQTIANCPVGHVAPEGWQWTVDGWECGRGAACVLDTSCGAHVEGHVMDYHSDGQPIYDAGRRCGAPGSERNGPGWLCTEHAAARKARGL